MSILRFLISRLLIAIALSALVFLVWQGAPRLPSFLLSLALEIGFGIP